MKEISYKEAHDGINKQDIEFISSFLNNGGDVESVDPADNYTLLMHASERESFEIVELLLEKGANINVTDNNGFNPLMLCVSVVRKKGERITNSDEEYLSHVRIAEQLIKNNVNLLQEKNGSKQRVLRDAAAISKEISLLIIDKLVNDYEDFRKEVNHQDSEGFTALHFAARRGETSIIKALVDNGADVNLSENYGFLPIHEATIAKKVNAVKELIQLGSDTNMKIKIGYDIYETGDSALQIAKKTKNAKIIDLLSKN